jgi:hypothetical protein
MRLLVRSLDHAPDLHLFAAQLGPHHVLNVCRVIRSENGVVRTTIASAIVVQSPFARQSSYQAIESA